MFLNNLEIVASQAGMMFLIALVGFVMFKVKLVEQKALGSMINLLLWAVVPAVMIKSFSTGFNADTARSLLIFAVISVVCFALMTLFAAVAFRNKPERDAAVMKAAVVLPNCGFMCLPLVEAFYGSLGVMYCSVFIAVFNLVLWTYGYMILLGDKLDVKKILLNPGILSLAVGLLLFFFDINLPGIVDNAVGSIASIQTPLAMLVIGAQLAAGKLSKSLGSSEVYAASFLRLIAIPAVFAVLLWVLPLPLDATAKSVMLLELAAPTGATVALLSANDKRNGALGSGCVAVSTLFSVLTMPLCVLLSSFIFRA